MTTTNDTTTAAEKLHVDPFPQAARERVLAALDQAADLPDAEGSESVYIGFIGTEYTVGFTDAGAFSLAHLHGGPSIHLTPRETLELWNMWDRLALTHIAKVIKGIGDTRKAREDAYVELNIAPNCEGSILAHPPRIMVIDDALFLQLKGDDGWDDVGYPVLEIKRMDAHDGLVLVATPEHVYLMTAADFDTPSE